MKCIEITPQLRYRFNEKWEKLESGCHKWTGARVPKGYGFMKIPGTRKLEYAHRLSWLLNKGPIEAGMFVCHTCDNPWCVNPTHLFLGTSKANQQDMALKGRSLSGERNPSAVLTRKKVERIRALAATLSQAEIGRAVGTSQINVSRIVRGVYWK